MKEQHSHILSFSSLSDSRPIFALVNVRSESVLKDNNDGFDQNKYFFFGSSSSHTQQDLVEHANTEFIF